MWFGGPGAWTSTTLQVNPATLANLLVRSRNFHDDRVILVQLQEAFRYSDYRHQEFRFNVERVSYDSGVWLWRELQLNNRLRVRHHRTTALSVEQRVERVRQWIEQEFVDIACRGERLDTLQETVENAFWLLICRPTLSHCRGQRVRYALPGTPKWAMRRLQTASTCCRSCCELELEEGSPMSISSYFDAIFCINLDSRPDRWQLCLAEFAAHDIVNVERVPGCPSKNPGRSPDGHWIGGHDGCTRSHRELLKRIAAGPHERVLVLEDDVQVLTQEVLQRCGVCNNPAVMQSFNSIQGNVNERFDQMVQHVPIDWDVFYLGCGYGSNPIARVHKHVIRCGRMLTTSSYAITKKFAKVWTELTNAGCVTKFREWGLPLPENILDAHPGPIDSLFGDYAYSHNYYVFQPRLMVQRQGLSNITLESSDYIDSMCNPIHEHLV